MGDTILVVDDQPGPRRALATELGDAGFTVIEASDGRAAWQRVCEDRPALVITDMVMPHSDGMELLSRIRSRSETPVIVFTAYGSVETAVSALKAGADEFVSSVGLEVEDLVQLVRRVLAKSQSPAILPGLAERLVGKSRAMERVRQRISGLAPLRTPVLVRGEPGTGRNTVIQALHELGSTAGGDLVRIEAEGFSPEDPIPRFEAAYLRDVERLSPEAQAHWAERIAKAGAWGSEADFRIFASHSNSLAARVRDGTFNRELGEALLRFEIELPPLRERSEDIPELAKALVDRIGVSLGRRIGLSAAACEFLIAQRWPGNVAQLEDVLEKVIAFSRGREIRRRAVQEVMADLQESLESIREQHDTRERAALLRAIQETGGNVSQTAEILGKSRSAVYRLIAKHGIPLSRPG